MKFLFLLIVVMFLSSTYAQRNKFSEKNNNQHINNQNNVPAMSNDEENLRPNKTGKVKKQCIPGLCSRVYRPVCGLVNGIPLTAPTMCHFKDKERCLREIMDEGEEMPTFQFLHEGVCTEDDPNILKENNIQRRPVQNNRPNRRRPNVQKQKPQRQNFQGQNFQRQNSQRSNF